MICEHNEPVPVKTTMSDYFCLLCLFEDLHRKKVKVPGYSLIPEDVAEVTVVTDTEGVECFYSNGRRVSSHYGEDTIYSCDIAEITAGKAIRLKHKSLEFCVKDWPMELSSLEDTHSERSSK